MLVPNEIPVTGREPRRDDGSAFAALVDFYRAFNGRDLAALADNWAPGKEPSMDNPIGGIRRGWPEICAGYERLFSGPARVSVEFFDYKQASGPGFSLFVGRERGTCITPDTNLELRIRTSRLFVLNDGRWRQLHHHGSIDEPALLGDYQRLILGAPLGTSG